MGYHKLTNIDTMLAKSSCTLYMTLGLYDSPDTSNTSVESQWVHTGKYTKKCHYLEHIWHHSSGKIGESYTYSLPAYFVLFLHSYMQRIDCKLITIFR